MPALRAFIVQDSPVLRENLAGTLEELAHVEIIGSAGDEASAVRWMSQQVAREADVVIVDLSLSSGTGLGVLRAAQRLRMAARRVVLTNYVTEEVLRRCAALGAERVFDKCRQIDELIGYCTGLVGHRAPFTTLPNS